MKRLLTILLVLSMSLLLVACGDATNTPDSDEEGLAIRDITAANWTEVVAKNFGLDLSLPEGWSVAEAVSPNKATNIELTLTVGGTVTYTAFGETVFAELKKDAVGPITKYGDHSTVYTAFGEAAGATGIASFTAAVDGDSGKSVTVNYFDEGATVSLSLIRTGSWQ